MTTWRLAMPLGLCAGMVATGALSEEAALPGDALRASKVRELTVSLSLSEAAAELEGSADSDLQLLLERARHRLYSRDCEGAAAILERAELKAAPEAETLAMIAKGCVFATVGTVVVEDVDKGVWIRFQDDEDRVLAGRLVDVAVRSRDVYSQKLGVDLPRPLRIELVRDQIALSMMTGLPWESAKTTGTIGVAKWGAVIMVSPRGAPRGYNFADTLAHEISHLAQTRASKDRAPLWVQEGVARMFETKWRDRWPHDDSPPADAMAFFGLTSRVGPDIDKIGASIAMLPSAIEAQVTYAKVQSFMGFWAQAAGEGSLGRLLHKMGEAQRPDDVQAVIGQVSADNFQIWTERWKTHLTQLQPMLSPDDRPDAPVPKHFAEVRRDLRLGQLFLERGHAGAARISLERAAKASPKEAAVTATLAQALLAEAKPELARERLANPDATNHNHPLFWALRARLFPEDRQRSLDIALYHDPFNPDVACDGALAGELPADENLRPFCEAARRKPH